MCSNGLPSSSTISLQNHVRRSIIAKLPESCIPKSFDESIHQGTTPVLSMYAAASLGHADSRRCGRAQAKQVQEHSTRRGQLGGVPRHPQEGGGDASADCQGRREDARRKPAGELHCVLAKCWLAKKFLRLFRAIRERPSTHSLELGTSRKRSRFTPLLGHHKRDSAAGIRFFTVQDSNQKS